MTSPQSFDTRRLVVPRHVAIIMDGNNRWAKARGLAGVRGHQAGVNSVRAVIQRAAERGVETLTLFAFSSENWKRPAAEVSALMELFLFALKREVRKLHRNGIRLTVIGERSGFSEQIQKQIARAEALTANNRAMHLVVAANYGGRWDIAQAARRLAERVDAGELDSCDIDEHSLHEETCLAQESPVDLCIRTSGEQRISNFMLWQLAYAEFYFSPLLWPDFGAQAFDQAVDAYLHRQRRFGMTHEQIESQGA
ncbi:polyprenyl diphosphate synthase [Pistricoccus aurantiacus]|uniref:Ditrans,polycis-undecaprenyl-diphosphate synthase ((2E,6E)-farnesyl-diphosphate specific) n=1 Tax=Pistricoccus aurantiacus TaxID=1883414 RepID=A0A5B8SNZ4_9GAMM|nr:polyprenyl diphosphate synthase [Pistricoccus aurantiacus]QEA38789.1 di-trans,poly-cis-decaprenylcistransferase [Pistricoccus aurantiacus]